MDHGRARRGAAERWWPAPALSLLVGALHACLLLLQAGAVGAEVSPQVLRAATDPQRALTAVCAAWWLAVGLRGLVRRAAPDPGSRGRAVVPLGHAAALSAMGVLSSGPGVPWCSTMALVTLPLVAGLTSRPALVRVVLPVCAAGAAATTFDAVGGRAGTVFGAFAAVSTVVAVVVPTVVVTLLESRLRATRDAALLQAVTDPLTGLLNRRGLEERAAGLTGRRPSAAEEELTCVVVVDVDHFKAVNDELGHEVGDVVLRAVADVLREHVRTEDLLVRHGGEEFAWVGLWPDAAAAVLSADRVRAAVAAAPMPHGGRVTLSLGVATSGAPGALRSAPSPASSVHRLVSRADAALYAAKRGGRDRVVLADDDAAAPPAPAPAPAPARLSAGAGAP